MSKIHDNTSSSVEGKIRDNKLHDILVQCVSNDEIEKQLAVFIHIKAFSKNHRTKLPPIKIYNNVNTREVEHIGMVFKKTCGISLSQKPGIASMTNVSIVFGKNKSMQIVNTVKKTIVL